MGFAEMNVVADEKWMHCMSALGFGLVLWSLLSFPIAERW